MKSIAKLVAFCLLSALAAPATVILVTEKTQNPTIPTPFNSTETLFQNQTHFLTFIQLGAAETATTATAYYNAIDPGGTKKDFPSWLVRAGFIENVNQWHSTGPQIVACDLGPQNGCDVSQHNPDGSLRYGDNIINADSHAIVLNAADLGFVRNQYVRCAPSCSVPNPDIFTYLENYPVNPFAASGNGGSGFPILTGYLNPDESKNAMESALTRPLGPNLTGCDPTKTDTALKCKISRIADVAFEWTLAPGSNSGAKYGKLYAYVFDDATGTELIAANGTGGTAPNTATKTLQPFSGTQSSSSSALDPVTGSPLVINNYTGSTGDPFAPNLDFIGFKQHPGVCFICHGGAPQALVSVNGTQVYPNQGRVNGFRLLPLDIRNLLFTSDAGGDQPAMPVSVAYTDRAHQELQIKVYNAVVLQTIPTKVDNDDTGATRVAHARELITGWYAGFPGDQNLTGNVQNDEFLPVGWREPSDGGTAKAGSEKIYKEVVGPFCRSCHLNRNLSLDFGTAANFAHEPDDIFGFAIRAACQQPNPPAGKKYMPLAHLTYQRYWQTETPGGQTMPFPANNPLVITNAVDQLAQYFGYGSVANWCALKN